jgi:hypothetical protein
LGGGGGGGVGVGVVGVGGVVVGVVVGDTTARARIYEHRSTQGYWDSQRETNVASTPKGAEVVMLPQTQMRELLPCERVQLPGGVEWTLRCPATSRRVGPT